MAGLTQQRITPAKGQAAFLPNQPILHNCVVDSAAVAPLKIGDVVTFATTNLTDLTVVKQAAVTDVPVGVVAYGNIKSGYNANDKISIYPANSFVYMEAGAANLTIGQTVGFNTSNQIVAASGSNGVIGKLFTQPAAMGDMVVVQILPGVNG